jgi:hypothetical protein
MQPITDLPSFPKTLAGLDLPLIIRETDGHGGLTCLVKSRAEAARVPLHRFRQPLAVEFIDVRNARDQLFRRYRFIVSGELGTSHGLHVSEHWEVRGRVRRHDDFVAEEEKAFITNPNPHREQFIKAARLLKLDCVAFDYSYDRRGELIVWEGNPYHNTNYVHDPRRQYLNQSSCRVFAGMLHVYLQRAGLEIPTGLRDYAEGDDSALRRAA